MDRTTNSEDVLIINYRPEYIQDITGLSIPECKRILFWIKEFYDENVGITKDYILNLAKGIKGGLL